MQEISRLIGGSLTVEDEDAVLSELAEIEQMEADALAAALPEAPTAAIETGAFLATLALAFNLVADVLTC